METNPRGLVLIINNINFHNNKHRPGSERDSDQLHNLFHNLGFNVDVRQNKTAFVSNSYHHDHEKYFVCTIISLNIRLKKIS